MSSNILFQGLTPLAISWRPVGAPDMSGYFLAPLTRLYKVRRYNFGIRDECEWLTLGVCCGFQQSSLVIDHALNNLVKVFGRPVFNQ